MTRTSFAIVALVLAFLLEAGCATTRKAYYNTWEKFGYAKRERLVDNVKEARQEQVDAKKQFASALEQFKSVVNFQGGDLEALYNKLNKEYQRADGQAEEVREKITGVKRVADALFTEWGGESKGRKDGAAQRRKSPDHYDKTRDSYKEIIDRMDSPAATMDPVLSKCKSRVLFLQHNLNAQAIASLKGTEIELGGDIDKLIK